MSTLWGLPPCLQHEHLERRTIVFRVARGEFMWPLQKRGQWLEKRVPRSQCLFIKGGRTSISMNIYGSPVKTPQLEVSERMGHWVKVCMFLLCDSGEGVRRLSFPLSTSLQKYWNERNQLISPLLTDPLPWPRTALSVIRKAGRIDLMGYYWAHNEARQQWWQVLKTLNTPGVISILAEDLLKN